jgi:hypothetical protein
MCGAQKCAAQGLTLKLDLLKNMVNDEHASLFLLVFSDEEKNVL